MRTLICAVAVALATPTPAWGDDCSLTGAGTLGVPLVEHSCFHTEYGPFAMVTATAGAMATPSTPAVDSVHTHYTVALPSRDQSVVTYTPARSGTWAVFGDGVTPIELTTEDGAAVPVLLAVPVDGCPALPVAEVVALEAGRRYLVRFGPTTTDQAIVVLEKMSDFETPYGRDRDGDGFGGDADVISTPCRPPAGYVDSTDDCDDDAAPVYPGAPEVCDGFDQDCDGVADDDACTLTGAGGCAVGAGAGSSGPSRPGAAGLAVALVVGLAAALGRRRSARRTSGALTLIALAAGPRDAVAEVCDRLGPACVDHTCLHARRGPFADVAATATSAGAPAVDRVHTLYRVTLGGDGDDHRGVVTYRPARTGAWALYVDLEVPVTVRGPDGGAVAVERAERGFACSYLHRATQHLLTAGVTYAVEVGPTPASRVALAFEYVDDFVTLYALDRDGDGHGDPASITATACAPPPGHVTRDDDCAVDDPTIAPSIAEDCGPVDRNCNGDPTDVGLACTVGIGACAVAGVASCPADDGPIACSATAAAAAVETCDAVDQDCDGAVDEGALCAEPDQPVCVGDSRGGRRCGCTTDRDCGAADSGRYCLRDGDVERCLAGCVAGTDRNQCPTGQRCSSTDPAVAGSCEPVPDDGGGCHSGGGATGATLALTLAIALAALSAGRRSSGRACRPTPGRSRGSARRSGARSGARTRSSTTARGGRRR